MNRGITEWTECPPERAGMDGAALDRAIEVVRGTGARAHLCVLRHGRVVLRRTFGCSPEALFIVYSAGKPFIALLTHLLAERGDISLDDSVAQHWPEYGSHGKDTITIRQVLQHRAGVPLALGNLAADALTMTDWERSVRAAARARPRWPPGAVSAYHIITYGFILGELVQRITGMPLREALRSEFLAPLGLHDTHLGLTDHTWTQHVPVRAVTSGAMGRQIMFNRRALRQAVIPAAGVSATAWDMARFYQMLLRGGELDGTRVLAAETVAQARQPSSEGEIDRILRRPIRWSEGFQLGGSIRARESGHPMGSRSSLDAFGHNGSSTCNAWVDPGRGLVFVYLTDLLMPRKDGALHQQRISDAVLAACR